jgi:hypothetical protein
MVDLWRFAESGDEGALRAEIQETEQGLILTDAPPYPSDTYPAPPSKGGPSFALLRDASWPFLAARAASSRGPVVESAYLFLTIRLNGALRGTVDPIVDRAGATDKFELAANAHSLWGAALIQFAQALAERPEWRRCAVCGRWMKLAGPLRSDRLTCSSTCRQTLYKRRQQRAYELHVQGKSTRQIAKELYAEMETIEGWIARHKEK